MEWQKTGDMAASYYRYNALGEQIEQKLLLCPERKDDPQHNRITQSSSSYEQREQGIYSVSTSTRYNAEGAALTSTQKQLISQLNEKLESNSITIDERGLTSESSVCYGDTPMKRLHTQRVPNSNSDASAIVIDGYTTEQSDQLGGKYAFTRKYSATGLISTTTDPRGNTTTSKADIAGRSIEQIDAAGNSSTISYSPDSDQVSSITDALGYSVNYSYDIRNRKVAEYGTATQPASYSYDDANRMTAFSTFRVDSGDIVSDPTGRNDGDTTSYSYHDATGLLTASTYPDSSQKIRSYNASNMLKHLINARGIVATHSYDALTGELKSVSYSDNTPDKNYSYNPQGQVTSITDATGTHHFSYNEYNQALNSTQKVNNNDFSVLEQYGELGRSAGYLHKRGASDMQIIAQSYDTKGRIGSASFTISGVKKDFHYSYLAGTSLLQTLAHPKGLRTERKYEAQRNLVTDINEMRGASGVSLRGYSYDAIARPATRKISRKGSVRDDKFEYNSRSELIASNHGSDNFPSGAPPLAQSYRLGTPSEESSGLGGKLLKSQFAYDYLPFGEVSVFGAYRSPVQWSSEIHDEELALVYYNCRHYNPSDGRWINRDPIGIEGGLNLYGFVGNSTDWVDILGLYAILCFAYKEYTIIGENSSDATQKIKIDNVFSGNLHANDPNNQHVEDTGPIPVGEYWLGTEYNRKPGNSGNYNWYRLYGDNGKGWKSYKEVSVQTPNGKKLIRSHFNLHTGLASNGCITVASTVERGEKIIRKAKNMINLEILYKKQRLSLSKIQGNPVIHIQALCSCKSVSKIVE